MALTPTQKAPLHKLLSTVAIAQSKSIIVHTNISLTFAVNGHHRRRNKAEEVSE